MPNQKYPNSQGSIVSKIIDCYSCNWNDARNQKIRSECLFHFFKVKSTFLTSVRCLTGVLQHLTGSCLRRLKWSCGTLRGLAVPYWVLRRLTRSCGALYGLAAPYRGLAAPYGSLAAPYGVLRCLTVLRRLTGSYVTLRGSYRHHVDRTPCRWVDYFPKNWLPKNWLPKTDYGEKIRRLKFPLRDRTHGI